MNLNTLTAIFSLCLAASLVVSGPLTHTCEWSSFIVRGLAWVKKHSPFAQFLELDDLCEVADVDKCPEITTSALLRRMLVASSILATGSSASSLGYCAVLGLPRLIPILELTTYLLATGIVLWRIPRITPYTLMTIYTFLAINAALELAKLLRSESYQNQTIHRPYLIFFSALRIAWSVVFIALAGLLPLRCIMPISNVASPSEKRIPNMTMSNPEDASSFWSWCTFSFVEPIIQSASKKTLNDDDVWQLSPYFRHRNLFEKQLEYRKKHPTHSLLRFLLSSNCLDLILVVLLEGWRSILGFVPAYSLNRLLTILASPDVSTHSRAYKYAFLTFAVHISFAQSALLHNYHSRRAYERARGQLFCAIHYKALRRRDLSGHGLGDGEGADGVEKEEAADLGKVVNIMQGDSYAVAQRFWSFAEIFVSPVRLVISLIYLYIVLGPSAYVGVAVLLFAYGVTYPLAQYNVAITRKMWACKDSRLNAIGELFQNLRFLKYYGWEQLWTSKIKSKRDEELRWKIKENIVNTAIAFVWTWIPSAVALTAFAFYTVVLKQPLTVSQAFTAIALFEQLRDPMRSLPDQIFALLHAFVSMQRIEKYMEEKEVPPWATSLSRTTSSDDQAKDSAHRTNGIASNGLHPGMHGNGSGEMPIGFYSAIVTWHTPSSNASDPFRLELDIRFQPGLNLVIGNTGSGKTALLSGLLGELKLLEGHIYLPKKDHQVAYSAQHPFLEHATIRENIIFGSPLGYDEGRYKRVVEACGLVQDLNIFEAGDRTEVGDRGVTLSGGQKARIALARAVYSPAKYILLDDPLAAVDVHTAQHIHDKCLCSDLMNDRTVILVTHLVALCLPRASWVVEIERGRVVKSGLASEFSGREDTPAGRKPEKTEDTNAPADAKVIAALIETEADGALGPAEARAEGRVSIHTYLLYIRAAGRVAWIATVVLVLLIRGFALLEQFFLARWGEAYEYESKSRSRSQLFIYLQAAWNDLPPPTQNVTPWLLLYTAISLSGALATLTYIILGYIASIKASRSLFERMLFRLVGAPVRFFDVTPLGRVLNRFTVDISTLDGAILNSSRAALSGSIDFLLSFLVIIVLIPFFAPLSLLIASIYIVLAPNYIRASRDLRRLESLALSPAFAGFDELLRGLVHVRAFAREAGYQAGFYNRVDKFQNFDHIYWQVSGWLKWRYDVLGSIIVFCTTCFALWRHLSDGLAALVIVQAGVFAEASRQLVKVGAQLELDFNSVERIGEYLDVQQEAPASHPDNDPEHGGQKRRTITPPAYWPDKNGEIVIDNLRVRYGPGGEGQGPDALRGMSLNVRGGERIGIVGRTGSGKSTLAMSFLRIVEPVDGTIVIDGIDIALLGLDVLRNVVTIVSQDVSLFTGTIRSNLDPRGEHSDDEIWNVLKRCHLVERIGEQGLECKVSPSGTFSAGERQLVALARGILRNSTLIILDEATSHMSALLDREIQDVIRCELTERGVTVLMIAHRLGSVMTCGRVVVLAEGRVVEVGSPTDLLRRDGSVFGGMCRRSAEWPFT